MSWGCQKIPFSIVFGLLLPKQLLCQEAACTTTQMYSIYKYVASVIRSERGCDGQPGPPMSWGVSKFHFREFSVSCSQTSSCARKPLVLRHRCIVYTSMWQVSLGLKENEMGSQTPHHYVRGGCKKLFSIFLGLLLPNQLQCQEAAYTAIKVYDT